MQQKRKNEHLFLAEKLYSNNHYFNDLRFIHHSLPETNIATDMLADSMFHKKITAPIYINAMTGGSEYAKKINQQLAMMARELKIPIATGSMSAAIKDHTLADTFTIMRQENNTGIILANIGAEYGLDDAKFVTDLIHADALQIHINTVQEAIMPEGRREFDFLNYIDQIHHHLNLPIIVKEVGFGMSRETIQKLQHLGIQYIDISGRGGTNFAAIESQRAKQRFDYMHDWGQTTIESLLEAYDSPLITFASGGVQTPLDVVKCLALKADYVGIAGMILHYLMNHSLEKTIEMMHLFIEELAHLYAILGAHNKYELQKTDLLLSDSLVNYCNQRQLISDSLATRSRL